MICGVAPREYCMGGSFHSQHVLHVPAGDFGAGIPESSYRDRRFYCYAFKAVNSHTHCEAKAV